MRIVNAGRQAVICGGFFDQTRHGSLAAVGDRAHILEHVDRTQGILTLTDTRPCQLIVIAREIKLADRGLDAVHLDGLGQSCRIRVFLHGFAAEFDGQLTEHTVARVGERFLDILFAVSVRAGDFLAADVDRAGARPLALEQVGDVLDSGVDGHNLEDRARNRVRGQQAVNVNAVPRGIVRRNVRRIGRIKRRCGHHAQNFTGFIVINANRSIHSVQSLIGDIVQIGINRQIQAVAGAERRIYAGEQIVAGQLIRERGERTRADVAVFVAYGVQCGAPDGCVIVVDAVAVLVERGQHIAVPVEDGAAFQLTGVVIEMTVVRVGGPVAAVHDKPEAEERQTQTEQCGEDQTENTAFFDFPHGYSSPLSSRRLGRRTANDAFCRVSVAFKKASMPHADSMDEPPLDTNGSVTPVNGRISTAPNTFRQVWNTSRLVAAHAAMV